MFCKRPNLLDRDLDGNYLIEFLLIVQLWPKELLNKLKVLPTSPMN